MSRITRIALVAIWSSLLSLAARCQCHEFAHDFALSGFDGPVRAYATFDDGHGPALYVGGEFLFAGELLVRGLARWDGTRWSAVGGGVVGSVRALAVYDDGSGPALYVGGAFQFAGGVLVRNIARWNGTSWSGLGTGQGLGVTQGGWVNALAVYDGGDGPKLYVAGAFLHAGGLVVNNIARWSAAGWEAFTGGASGYPTSLCVFDEGSGPKLVVAGQFNVCGLTYVDNIAQFDGLGFTPLGAGTDGQVLSLTVFDDGSGPALVAGGNFASAGGAPAARIASWRNGAWSALGGGLDAGPTSLAVFDEGAGARLFAGGAFTQAGGQPAAHLARWDGASWSVPGAGDQVGPTAAIPALGVHDDGSGAALYVGTDVRIGATSWTHGIGRWDGSAFHAVGPARNNLLDGPVSSFAVYDDGSGAALYALGSFGKAGGNTVHRIARWNGARWSPLEGGLPDGDTYSPLAVVQHASGARLYAYVVIPSPGGNYSELRSWDGNSWSTLVATSPNSQISALAAYDDGSGEALYVGGDFHSLGGIAADGIARFDGSSWTALGLGLSGSSPYFGARVLSTQDFGLGPVLVVSGVFDAAGGQPALNVARWDGTSWAAFGAGLQTYPNCFAVFDDGSGPALYSGAAPGAQGHLQRWDGSQWSLVPGGPDDWIDSLAVFDDGSGPALYLGGNFSHVGTTTAYGLARWNGSQWSAPADGVRLGGSAGAVWAMQVFDDGTGGGPDLYVGGNFDSSGGVRSPWIGKWSGCSAPIASFCHGDGGELPCPCWNNGSAGHGCANSANATGAQLGWSGATSSDTLVLQASGELPTSLSVFLQGDAQQAHAAFGDGLRCVGGSLKRLYVHNASGGSVAAPIGGEPSIRARSAALGDPIAPGTARFYQVYYRDPQLAFCPAPVGNTWNVSNGVVVNW